VTGATPQTDAGAAAAAAVETRVLRLLRDGYSVRQAAQETGVAVERVQQLARDFVAPLRGRAASPLDPGSLPLAALDAHPGNVRDDDGDLSELAASIRSLGVLQPLLVTPGPAPGRYTIIAGHRRAAAARLAGLAVAPAVVRLGVTGHVALEAMLAENLHRRALNPIEEAQAYDALRNMGRTQEEIVAAVGKAQSHVGQRLELLRLAPDTQRLVATRQLTIARALSIARSARPLRADAGGEHRLAARVPHFNPQHGRSGSGGGVHGDIPIEPTGGAGRRRPGRRRGRQRHHRTRFITDFALRLFQRQGSLVDGQRRPPIFVALDEAARYIPQTIPHGNPDLARCLGAWEQMVEEGRNVGIGVGLFTQRSARINKSVAELSDAMAAFRTTGPNSIAAIIDWLGEHVPKAEQRGYVEQVRKLPVGTALVVSPGWLNFEGVVRIRARETFDSSATPKAGERRRKIEGTGAVVDLATYQARMAETIERAKAEDPRELRKQVAELRRELAAARNQPTHVVEVEVPMLTDWMVGRLETTLADLRKHGQEIIDVAQDMLDAIGRAQRAQGLPVGAKEGAATHGRRSAPAASASPRERVTRGTPNAEESRRRSPQETRPAPAAGAGEFRPSEPQQRILDSLAWFTSAGLAPVNRAQLAIYAGVSPKSSGYDNNLGALRTAGLVDYPQPGRVTLTEAGTAVAQPADDITTTEELHEALLARLGKSRARILRALIAAYPNDIDRRELAELAEVSPASSGYDNNLGALRSLGLIDYPTRGRVVARDVLFLGGDA
jgi:ParB/RepB/Spo0J family partition protein